MGNDSGSSGYQPRKDHREDNNMCLPKKYEPRILKFRYRGSEDPKDVREVLLIVSALIAAVTFQAGIYPPGGVWQEGDPSKRHVAGQAIYASQRVSFHFFWVFNMLALSTSVFTTVILTYGFPFYVEIWVATVSMLVTYASSIIAITPNEHVKLRFTLLVAFVPPIAWGVSEVINYVKCKFGKDQVGAVTQPQPDSEE